MFNGTERHNQSSKSKKQYKIKLLFQSGFIFKHKNITGKSPEKPMTEVLHIKHRNRSEGNTSKG